MEQTPSGGALSIGAVLQVLREEFPEVTVSKIRFLETEGLVEPRRSPSGYRKFSAEDIERLSYVLRMQRDHYLPLAVIRDQLDARSRAGQAPPVSSLSPSDPAEQTAAPAAVARLGRAELLAAVEVTEEELAEWESYGLLGPDSGGDYEIGGVTIARLMADLARFGLQPRHLRAVKAAADREADMVEKVVAPLRRHQNPRTRAEAESAARELAALSVQLHAALLRTALRLRSS